MYDVLDTISGFRERDSLGDAGCYIWCRYPSNHYGDHGRLDLHAMVPVFRPRVCRAVSPAPVCDIPTLDQHVRIPRRLHTRTVLPSRWWGAIFEITRPYTIPVL